MEKKVQNSNRYGNINRRQTGGTYEQTAGVCLKKQGYRILEYNYRCRYAEIDIIAEDDGYLVFCEVKYRQSATDADTLEAVNWRKQQRICRGALFYMCEHQIANTPCRFDVVGISGCGSDIRITLIKNAFDYI